MKKRIISLSLVLVMAMSMLAGCGSSSSSSTNTQSATASQDSGSSSQSSETQPSGTGTADSSSTERGPQKIVLWHGMSDDAGDLMEKFVQDFNDGPGKELQIEVESIYQGSYADLSTKFRTILQSEQYDQLPDLIQIDATGIADYIDCGYAYSVDDAMAKDPDFDISDYMDAAVKAWNYGGVQYGMPFPASTTAMYYNKTLLDAAGITAAPTTFAEITAAHEKLPATNADGVELVTFAQIPNTPTLANWIGQIPGTDADASYVVNNKNGRTGNATELVCDKEGTLATFLTEWKAMYDAGALKNLSSGLSDMFFAGQLVFFTTSTSNLNTMINSIDGRFELGCTYYPRVNADANYGATISGACLCMLNGGDEAKVSAAWDFLKYLMSADVQAEFSMGTGYFAVNNAATEQAAYKDFLAEYPQFQAAIDQVNMTSPDMMGVTVGPSIDFYMTIQDLITEMLEENMSVEDTVDEMSSTLNDLLYQYSLTN